MKHRENITQQGILFVLSMVTNTKVLNYTKKNNHWNPNIEVKNDFASHWHLQFQLTLNLNLHLHRNSQTWI